MLENMKLLLFVILVLRFSRILGQGFSECPAVLKLQQQFALIEVNSLNPENVNKLEVFLTASSKISDVNINFMNVCYTSGIERFNKSWLEG